MKVFIPMPDEVSGKTTQLNGRLVPFNPEFLAAKNRIKDRKPRNWISDNDYTAACKRLRESFAPA